jgi:hypothetical protein
MPEKKKRTYTFRKNQVLPYESGSIMHEEAKAQRQIARNFNNLEPKKRRKKDNVFF